MSKGVIVKTAAGRKKRLKTTVDPVRVQVSVKVADVPGAADFVTKGFLNHVMKAWIETGETPKGIKVTAIRWKNPVRKDKSLAVWKSSDSPGETLTTARTTLRRLLQRFKFDFSHVGTRKRTGKN